MPIGIYQKDDKSSPERDDWVAVCLPNVIAQEGLSHHALQHGPCDSFTMPVFKQLITVPGDIITITRTSIQVNQKTYKAPRWQIDHQGKPLKTFLPKATTITTNNYWLYGANNPTQSWDSRYFGGVTKEDITGSYSPLWIKKGGEVLAE